MKIIIIMFFITLNFSTFAAMAPSSQNVVDQYVETALNADIKILAGDKRDPWTCHYMFVHDSSGRGDTMLTATTRMQLSCIKNQCEELISSIATQVEKIKDLSESDFSDLLEFQGKSKEEIQKALIQHKNKSYEKQPTMTCENSALVRMTAFDSCFAIPVECSKK
jgi:hypothetical protein